MSEEREERLQRYLDRRMDRAEQESFEGELLEDSEALGDAYDELAVRDAVREARSTASRGRARRDRSPRPRRRWLLPSIAAAAVAATALFVLLPLTEPEPEVFRGTGSGAPRAIGPVGEVGTPPDRFAWTRDPGAARYRLELFGPDGQRTLVHATPDTFFVLETEALIPTRGSWRVTSVDSIGVGAGSTGRVEFRVH